MSLPSGTDHPRAVPRSLLRSMLSAVVLLMAIVAGRLEAQSAGATLHWDYPISLAEGRYFRAEAGEELMFLVWQDTEVSENGGDSYLSLAATADGRIWRRFDRFAGPFPFVGKPVRIYSIAVTKDDICYIAVAEGPRRMVVYRTDLVARQVEEIRRFAMPSTTVSPRLFAGADGSLRIFAIRDARSVLADSEFLSSSASAIYYTTSADGSEWSDFRPLVGSTGEDAEIETKLQFLPDHLAAFGREYVVFPVFYTDENDNLSNQLYLKMSDDGGMSWSEADLITDFRDPVFTFGQIDNQGPKLVKLESTVALVWERGLASSNSNIYLLEIESDGTVNRSPEQVTRRTTDHRQPQIFSFRGETWMLWFDNQVGTDRIKLGRRQGTFWSEQNLTAQVSGSTSFGKFVEFKGEPFVFYERLEGDRRSIEYLKPDESIRTPLLAAVDFTAGGRYRRDSFSVQWVAPEDSSGISGYSVHASRDPEARPPRDASVSSAVRRSTIPIDEDGRWYIQVSAVDLAGNWSEPSTISVVRDTTPPGPVTFVEPDLDTAGYLVANTYSLAWTPPDDDDIAGYSYSFQYLFALGQRTNIVDVSLRKPSGQVLTTEPRYSFRNIDNGLWALSVAAIDTVGNRGEEQILFVQTNRYIPVTYVTGVTSKQDDLGRIELTITGRGFSDGGLVSSLVFDRDAARPYDFEFGLDSGVYRVATDRIIYGIGIDGVDEGEYYVGVVHPRRGAHFDSRRIAVEPSGQVKFGDFRSYRPRPLLILTGGRYTVEINIIIFILIIVMLVFLVVFSSVRIVAVSREAIVFRTEVRALLTGELTEAERKERMKTMKRRGMGLRIKFALFTIILVISIVLIVAFPLGITMTAEQELLLAQGLRDQTNVLLESIRTGAETFLPQAVEPDDIDGRLQLSRLPRQRSGVVASRYVIITGQAQKEIEAGGASYQPAGFDYVWAQDDPAILGRIDTEEFLRGRSRLSDPVSLVIPEIAARIDSQAKEVVGDLPVEIQRLVDERQSIVTRIRADITLVSAAEQTRFTELDGEIQALQQQLFDALSKLDTESAVYPEFNVEHLDRAIIDYVFYKPIVYAVTGEDTYFRGLVRVGITTEPIIRTIVEGRQQILVVTALISLIAVGIGVVGALVLSSIIIIPIRRLVQGVERIRDTEDKEELKAHVIDVRTRDEIALLADTVNQMTQGLAAAAAANKDLILGKDTQKMFVPLEQDPKSGRKLTTASDKNSHVEFFGYYEGAKGVSGDYFDFTRLDAKRYAIVKCDVAGKGVPASLIMVEVATIFLDYFRNWSIGVEGVHLDKLAYRINDLLEQRSFKGRFATLLLCILDIETGEAYLCNAGDKFIHVYESGTKRTAQKELPESPAAGVFSSDLVEMGPGFTQVKLIMKPGDMLLLFTDGVEEDKRTFRDVDLRPIACAESALAVGERHGNHGVGETSEEFGISRIHSIIDAVMARGTWTLEKYHLVDASEQFDFDFSDCSGTVEEAVLALASVDKVFRIYRPTGTGREDRVRVDVKIDRFLQSHFRQYSRYFRDPVLDDQFPEYVHFPGLREDDQYDDLTILGVRKI